MWNNAVNAWWPLLFYAAPDAPRFRTGMIAMLGTCAATLAVTALVWALERREHRLRARAHKRPSSLGEDESDSHSDSGRGSPTSKSRPPRSDDEKVRELGIDADVADGHNVSDSLKIEDGGTETEKGWIRRQEYA